MKKSLPILIALLYSQLVMSQKDKDIPAFGKVDKADLEIKTCDFDPHAEAEVLFDVGEVYCQFMPTSDNNPVSTELERHVRIRVLSDKGVNVANIHIPYYSYHQAEYIRNLSAQTYNLDASGHVVVTKVDKKQVFDKHITSRESEEVFTFPDVKAGSIIEYKYTLTGDWFNELEDWYFQRSIPVKLSRYTLNFPPEFEVYGQPYCSMPLDRQTKTEGTRELQIYTMRDVPALRDEPFMSCDEDYLQKLTTHLRAFNGSYRINLVPTWPKKIKELMEDEDFGLQLKKNIPRTSDLEAQLKPLKDSDYRKMQAIYRYVSKNMEWNGYSNIWALDGVKAAWKDKKGTSGEINLILVNLLKDAGLDAHPILVSTHEHGAVRTMEAYVSQFNKVMADVTLNNHTYILDATEKDVPARLIPPDVMATEGLVIEKLDTYEWGWQTLWDPTEMYKKVVSVSGMINDQGIMNGHAYIASFDYSRLKVASALKEGTDKFIEKQYTSNYTGINVDSLKLDNEKTESLPLVQHFHFTMPITSSGDYKYFSVNLFAGLQKNPFVEDTRTSDIFFGANQQYTIMGSFTIPDGYSFDALPKSVRMITPDTSTIITRMVATQGNQLSVRMTIEFKKPFYTVADYPYFKEFYKKLFGLLNEQIVIRKKLQS